MQYGEAGKRKHRWEGYAAEGGMRGVAKKGRRGRMERERD